MQEVIKFTHTDIHLLVISILHLCMHCILKFLHVRRAEVLLHLSRVKLRGLLPLKRSKRTTDRESVIEIISMQAVVPQFLRVRIFLNKLRNTLLLSDVARQGIGECDCPRAGYGFFECLLDIIPYFGVINRAGRGVVLRREVHVTSGRDNSTAHLPICFRTNLAGNGILIEKVMLGTRRHNERHCHDCHDKRFLFHIFRIQILLINPRVSGRCIAPCHRCYAPR